MMVNATLKKVVIKNFKSLHDCEIDIMKLNVVVGANASGKSNLVEAFRLLKKIYIDKDPFPFLEWWGYNNVVWQKKEELPITIGLLFSVEGYDAYFETNFIGAGGKFQIFREVLDIKGYVKFEKEGEWITVNHDLNFLDKIFKNFDEYDIEPRSKTRALRQKNKLREEGKFRVDLRQGLFESLRFSSRINMLTEKSTANKFVLSYVLTPTSFEKDKKPKKAAILCPVAYDKRSGYFFDPPLYTKASDKILSLISDLLILYPLNIRMMKVPQPFRREGTVKEDGTNIASVYHTIYLKEGKIPEEIYNPFTMVFPKIDVRPHITDDGRVMIKFLEEGLELLPPNTSDGFYKILTILIAIYLKPPLLIVDELENSLHPETLELILDTIRISGVQAIITTHSPVVVDMTEPGDIILAEKEHGESKFIRAKDPEKIRESLREKGITFSEGWLYGEVLNSDE